MSRNAQLVRLLSLIGDLSASRRGVLVADLLAKHGVSRRTLERDMEALVAAGVVVESLPDEEPGRIRKRIVTGPGATTMPASTAELAAARAALRLLEREAPATVAATFRILLDRLEQSQPAAIRVDTAALDEAQGIVSRAGPLPDVAGPVLRDIQDAILARRRVRITYRKGGSDEGRDYLAEPYGLLYGARTYLVWRGCEDGKWRKFALPWIDAVEILDDPYAVDPGFDLEEFAARSIGVFLDEPLDVELVIGREGRHRLEGFRFHPSQIVEDSPDGGAIVRFHAAGMDELCAQLFGWEPHLSIAQPRVLQDVYLARLEAAAAAVRSSLPPSPDAGGR